MTTPVDWVEIAGYAASLLVFLTFWMKTLIPLRLIAIASNVVFIVYGYGAGVMPVLVLHSALLPLNLLRTWEQYRAFRKIRATADRLIDIEALVPFMRQERGAAGSRIFAKGDRATTIYYIAGGEVLIPEIGRRLGPGALFGEIGPFSPERLRSASAVCVTDCEFLVMTDRDIMRHCLNDPAFGLFLTRLIAGRIVENEALPAGAVT